MSITTSSVVANDRGMTWQYTGDGATTASTATFNQKLDSGIAINTATIVTAPTSFFARTEAAGLIFPFGTQPTVASSAINATTGVVTVTANAAVANGTVAYVAVTFNHEAN
jgi:hypothetical protein